MFVRSARRSNQDRTSDGFNTMVAKVNLDSKCGAVTGEGTSGSNIWEKRRSHEMHLRTHFPYINLGKAN